MPRRSTARAAVLSLVAASAGVLAPAPLPPAAYAQSQDPAGGWSVETRARADVGYDTNVFQAEPARGDGYSRLGGTLDVRRELGPTTLDGYAEANRKFYWRFSQADETEVYLDLTARRRAGPLLAGLALRSAYIDLRFLDREGNLLPRTTFASLSNRLLAFADLRVMRDLYMAGEAAYRLKDYEETRGLTSLDYGEWSAELEATRYLPARVFVRLQGSLEQRGYQGRRAADASGFIDPDNPELRLRRREGELRLRKRWARDGLAEATGALRSSQDLFEDELSYGQRSLAVRLRQPLGRTLLTVGASIAGRDFELRRSGTGEALEEDYLTLEAEAEHPVGPAARLRGGYSLFRLSSNDLEGGYTVGTLQMGASYDF